MRKYNVRTPSDALVYLADCSLATVSHMATLKSRKAGEYNRQKSIAQCAVTWIVEMECAGLSGTRVHDVMNYHAGNVDLWARSFEVAE